MSIRKEDLHRLVDFIEVQDEKTAYDFLSYLVNRHKNPYYLIDQLEPEDIPLNEEEQRQSDSKDEDYIPLEDIKDELKL